MIIDVNTWFGHMPWWPMRFNSADEMLRKMDACGVERAFACSMRGVWQDPRSGNLETLQACERHPDRLWPAFIFTPYRPPREDAEDLLAAHPVTLVKLLPQHHAYDLNEEPWLGELAETCAARGVPVMFPNRIMTSQRFPPVALGMVRQFIAQHPRTTFILASINYLLELQTALNIMRNHANVLLETSGMMGLDEVSQVAAEVGVGRLLHGSCMILQTPGIGPLRIHAAQLDEAEKRQILSGNAIRLFRLEEHRIATTLQQA